MTPRNPPHSTHVACLWCDAWFTPSAPGGREKRFCNSRCQVDFNTALRNWARRVFDAGLVGVDTLKMENARSRVVHDGETASPRGNDHQPGELFSSETLVDRG